MRRTTENRFWMVWAGLACAALVGCDGDSEGTTLEEPNPVGLDAALVDEDAGDAGGSKDGGGAIDAGGAEDVGTADTDGGGELDSGDSGTEECYPLSFLGGFNGQLEGATEQCVFASETATPVEAVPRSGFRFESWSDGSTQNPRIIANPQAAATLTAQFSTEGLTTVWLGHSFIRWNIELLYDVVHNDADFEAHSDWMTFRGGAGGSPGNLWNNREARASGQRMIREQQPDNVVMTYHPMASEYQDYANWVDFTLMHSPEARFYISLTWRSSPFGPRFGQGPLINEESGVDLEAMYVDEQFPAFNAEVLSRLRANYPDNEFVLIPQVIAADAITKAHFAGTLTYGENNESLEIRNVNQRDLLGHEQAIYDDFTGHPGGPLRLLTMMLYFRYIYGVDVQTFGFWQAKQSFSNEGLEGVGPRQAFDAPYDYYNGFDFPAVADDIFRRFGRGE